jgi:hypothetical protein
MLRMPQKKVKKIFDGFHYINRETMGFKFHLKKKKRKLIKTEFLKHLRFRKI